MADAPSEATLRAIYEATVDDLYRFVSSRCRHRRDFAEDVVQETWLRAVRSWQAKGVPDQPQAWLTTVARNILINAARRTPTEMLEEGHAMIPSNRADERAALLMRAMARLPAGWHALLRAFHLERTPVAAIAAAHGMSERAVEGRLRRARQQLKIEIESDPESEGEIR